MRHRRWLELVKDYDYEILYHPGKANRIANTLSRKSSDMMMTLGILPKPLQKEIFDFNMEMIIGKLSVLTLQSNLLESIKLYQEKV